MEVHLNATYAFLMWCFITRVILSIIIVVVLQARPNQVYQLDVRVGKFRICWWHV